jgi:hypothetical protein
MALDLPSPATLGVLAYETWRFSELRDRLRHQLAPEY